MATKHMKKYSFVVREMYGIPLHPLEWLKLKTLKVPSIGKDVEQLEVSNISGKNSRWHHHFSKHYSKVLQTSTCYMTQWSHSEVFYTREMNIYVHIKSYANHSSNLCNK